MKQKGFTIDETFDLAVKNQQKNNLQNAENFYNEVLKINPNHFKSVYNLGILFAQTKKFDISKTLFKKAAQIQPKNAMVFNNIVNIFFETGHLQKAISSYESNPNSA